MIQRVLSVITLLTLVACSSSEKVETPVPVEGNPEVATTPAVPAATPNNPVNAVWSYSGAFAPQFWGDLDPSFIMCKEGKHQSPIDLKWQKPAPNNPFSANYVASKATVEDTGNLLKLQVEPGNSVRMRSSVYNLQSVDIHSPSEHSLSGKTFPLELQFVHKNDKDFYAVVSVFVKQGKASSVADQIIASFPESKNSQKLMESSIEMNKLLPERNTLYNYAGSLTYPPCAEGVNWIVLNTPLEFSKEQIDAFKARYDKNARPTQALNGRATINY